ncbi:MAG: hypothetical protein IJU79_06415 [Desulfovibrionaceae bacterium]|nr:hypothetical protein [Desulfovibrionaceae bacterium]
MATIVSQSELVRKAAEYINEKLAQDPKANLSKLLDDAGMRFNLTPLDAASLERIFTKDK